VVYVFVKVVESVRSVVVIPKGSDAWAERMRAVDSLGGCSSSVVWGDTVEYVKLTVSRVLGRRFAVSGNYPIKEYSI
jgi:hypothetical protein